MPGIITKCLLRVYFWNVFEIAPEIFPDPEVLGNYPISTEKSNEHELTPEMRERLNNAKKRFSTYEENGSGKTKT